MKCTACPLRCGADREIRAGACGVKGISVAKAYLHPYEEPFLAGKGGSGAVFFSGCSLKCVFCQNYDLSRARRGKELSPEELSSLFLRLEEEGAENIDLVTPDHISSLIAVALSLHRPHVPVVYNSSAYALLPALEEISPYVDIWLPDFKFSSPSLAERLTGRKDYPEVARQAISYMAKQPIVWEGERLKRGIAVRCLVLPGHVEDCKTSLDFLASVLPDEAPLSLMRQYFPAGEASSFPELSRTLTDREYDRAVEYALALGFKRLYTQDKESADAKYVPDWDD